MIVKIFLVTIAAMTAISPASVMSHEPDLSKCERLRLELFDVKTELNSAYMSGVFVHDENYNVGRISLDEANRRLTAFGEAAEKFMLTKTAFWFCMEDALFWERQE